jgi:dTDP-4-dehydrorhamnose 3,5-epimerase
VKVIRTEIPDVLLLEPKVFSDERGFFFESYNRRTFHEATGLHVDFVQDNHSHSAKGVLRGLHYQIKQPQGKLIRVVEGEIFDSVVDIRRSSPTFGRAFTVRLTSKRRQMLWVPPGFAHGFCVISDAADVLYKSTDFYAPQHERTLLWSDTALHIDWPLTTAPLLSAKDAAGVPLNSAELFP